MCAALAAAAQLGLADPAWAQERTFVKTETTGDVTRPATPHDGRVHVTGSIDFETADYFRGAFDDVRESLDQLAIGPSFAVVFELLRERPGPVRDLTLTAGTSNGLVIGDPIPGADPTNRDWYESNNHVGLGARLAGDWLAGLTYTAYTSPNAAAGTNHELALAAAYAGPGVGERLKPQAKVAARLNDDGVYAELRLEPEVPAPGDLATLSVPIVLGTGFDDYYGPGTGAAVYGAAGLTVSVPLAFVPRELGAWNLVVGGDVLLRSQDIRRTGRDAGEDSTVVLIGRASITFTY